MKKEFNPIELATGFLMGLFVGSVLELVLVLLYHLFCRIMNAEVFFINWWMYLPIPLAAGAIMARAIASLHLEDY